MKANFDCSDIIKTFRVDKKVETEAKEAIKIKKRTLPWYISGGAVRPSVSLKKQSFALFPHEARGKDRVTDQLMFLPPDKEEKTVKKILMWNGLSSWGGVKPEREEFLRQECPVDACSIVTDRDDAEHVDMVLFKDHFVLPTFDRPRSQIWMIFMLGIKISCFYFKDFLFPFQRC